MRVAAASTVSSPSPTTSCVSGRPELDHAGAAEHAAVDLLDPAVPVFESDALDSHRFVGERIAHQRDQARQVGAWTEHAVGMEAQAAVDVLRQLGDVDAAGLVEIALGHRTEQRLRRGPDRFDEGQLLGTSSSPFCGTWFPGPGQSLMWATASATVMPSTRVSQSSRLPRSPQPKQ